MIRRFVWSRAIAVGFALMLGLNVAPVRAADPADDLVHVKGRVLGPDGRPMPGAAVYAVGDAWGFDAPLAEMRAAADGSFEIAFSKSHFKGEDVSFWRYTAVAAVAPGFAPAWDQWDQTDSSGNLVLQLTAEDVPIEGRIVDLEGRPVKGAMIKLQRISTEAKPLNALDITGEELSYLARPSRPQLPGFVVTGNRPIQTDEQGKFTITGIGKDRTAVLQVRGDGLAISELEVVTRKQETDSRSFQNYIEVRKTVYGASFEFVIEPGRVVEGTVRDAQTKQPLAGVTVQPSQWTRIAKSITDASGHYRIEGLRRKGVEKISAIPNDEQCYFMRDATLPNTEGSAPTTIDFELHRGTWITGKVTNAVTGEPVEGTRINYLPYVTNLYVDKLPEFHGHYAIPGPETRYVSDAKGMYRVVTAPGQAIVSAWCVSQSFRCGTGADKIKAPINPNGNHFDTYRPYPSKRNPSAMKDVEIADNVQNDTRVDFELDPGITIHIKVVDPQSNPLVGVAVYKDHPGFSMDYKKTAMFDAVAFGPDEQRDIIMWYMPRRLGKVLRLKPADAPNGELTVMLEPLATMTGRLLGNDGFPMAHALVLASYDTPGTGTDADGRFKLTVLPGGRSYQITGSQGRDEFNTDAEHITIKAGETKDLGDVRYKKY
ncbi:MAG TPA: hypothetical protein VH370_02680 [Humisphaera sp.]|jgi:protocatechuate 3,4-dioxygenase beta subunit|nr:hypothetical protein [Humisphaera sp.]